MSLTSFMVEKAKPRDKPYKLTDSNGLHLLVTPTSKLWRFRYRFAGKENTLGLGSFPEVSLAEAREKRDDVRKLLRQGINPSQKKKDDERSAKLASQNTFGALAQEHLKNLEDSGAASSTIDKNRWLLEDLAAPLTSRPVTEIKPAEILDICKKIEKAGKRETARRLRGVIGTVIRYAIATQRAETDPTYALRGALLPPIVQHRPAITDERELGVLMACIDDYRGTWQVRAALKLAALTMTRPIELRWMRRTEINWPKATWSIPADRLKMRRPHDVPLSRQALAILRDIWPLSQGDGLVLPSVRSVRRALAENALNAALRRMGYTKDEVCTHGFRTSASTILNERGFDERVIEVALAHLDENEVRRAYNRAKYWKQRVQMLQAWADLLDEFRHQAKAARA